LRFGLDAAESHTAEMTVRRVVPDFQAEDPAAVRDPNGKVLNVLSHR
jgi:hypothetical protein